MSKSENLSEDYKRTEAEHARAVAEKSVEKENENLVVFFHVARKGQLGNFSEERRLENGMIAKGEQPIRFDDHLYITKDQKEIDFIRKHDSFGIHCFECESIDNAMFMRQQQYIARQKTSVNIDLNIRADGLVETKVE